MPSIIPLHLEDRIAHVRHTHITQLSHHLIRIYSVTCHLFLQNTHEMFLTKQWMTVILLQTSNKICLPSFEPLLGRAQYTSAWRSWCFITHLLTWMGIAWQSDSEHAVLMPTNQPNSQDLGCLNFHTELYWTYIGMYDYIRDHWVLLGTNWSLSGHSITILPFF